MNWPSWLKGLARHNQLWLDLGVLKQSFLAKGEKPRMMFCVISKVTNFQDFCVALNSHRTIPQQSITSTPVATRLLPPLPHHPLQPPSSLPTLPAQRLPQTHHPWASGTVGSTSQVSCFQKNKKTRFAKECLLYSLPSQRRNKNENSTQ